MENQESLYRNLEKDVDDLVNNLELNINSFLKQQPKTNSISGNIQNNFPGSGVGYASPETSTPNSKKLPKWRGVRGLWRWLWKGKSPDNPDYAHLYKNENFSCKSLHEYNEYLIKIDELADIIISDFSLYNENSQPEIRQIFNNFKIKLKEKLKKYFFLVSREFQSDKGRNQSQIPQSQNSQSLSSNLNPREEEEDQENVVDSTPDEEIERSQRISNRNNSKSLMELTQEVISNIDNIEEPNVIWFTLKKKIKKIFLPKLIAWLADKNIDPGDSVAARNVIKQKLNWADIPDQNFKQRFKNLIKIEDEDEINQIYKKLTKNKFDFYEKEQDFSHINDEELDDFERSMRSDSSADDDASLESLFSDEDDLEPSDPSEDDLEPSDPSEDDLEPSDPSEDDKKLKQQFKTWALKNFSEKSPSETVEKLKEFGYEISEKLPEDNQIEFLNSWNNNLISFEENEIKLKELIDMLSNIINNYL